MIFCCNVKSYNKNFSNFINLGYNLQKFLGVNLQNNAFKTLKSIVAEHNKKLILTLALVLAENGLFLAYPIFAGFAINAIEQGNTSMPLFTHFLCS